MHDEDTFDRRQWRALVLAALRHDLRRSGRSLGLASGNRTGGLTTILLLQLLIGAVLSLPLWTGVPVFPVAVLHLTYLMLSVLAMLLLEAQTLVISPADYDLVAPRPVSSRTFFAARVATLLAYVLVIAAAQGLFPLVAYFAAGGWHPVRGVLGVVATLSVTLTTAAAAIALHGLVLRHAAPARLRALLTVLQLTTSFGLYGLLVLLPGGVSRAYVVGPIAERPPWLWAVPTAWSASLLEPSSTAWWTAPLALAIPALAWWAASRWLGIDYAAQAAAVNALPATGVAPRVSPRFRTGEARAIALLVRAQFRYDMRFRLTVLGIVPLTIIYLLLGVVDRDLARHSHGHPAMVYVAVMLFPVLLKGAFARSDAYPAAWVFYASPVRTGRVLLGQRTVLVSWFLGPYIAAVGLLLAYMLPSPFDAAVAVVVMSLVSHALLLLVLLVDPVLPFSSPPQVGASTRSVMIAVVPAVLLGQFLPSALNQLSMAAWRAAAAVLMLFAINIVLDKGLRRRVDQLAARVEFSS